VPKLCTWKSSVEAALAFLYITICSLKKASRVRVNPGISQPKIDSRATTYSFLLFINHISSDRRIALEVGDGIIVAYWRSWNQDQNEIIHRYQSISVPAMANLGIVLTTIAVKVSK
jgi:hypothetical protein